MKKLSILLLLAITIATTSRAQNDPISLNLAAKHQDTVNTLETQFAARTTYVPFILATVNVQTISHHRDTMKGAYLTVLTASRLDTINFVHANYTAGYIFSIICTASSNDSTLIIPDSGTINGASSYWFNGTYKHSSFYYDGTNYWLK
jgi:hypothetical protein